MVKLLRKRGWRLLGMSKNVEIIGLRDLKPDPQNARKHTLRNVGMIAEALQEVGAARSIVIDEEGVILAGNATAKAARQAGLARVKVVDADGSEIIAVRRTNLTERQKKRLALIVQKSSFQHSVNELTPVSFGCLMCLS
jgi:ParB-like chromosome segregation protein Spo0J